MFGQNSVAKQRPAHEGLLVHSIFYTIQGEGPYAGEPAIFIRLAGCNLRCWFCDTEFEKGAQVMSARDLYHDLLKRSAQHQCKLFVITGGEPLLQHALIDLFDYFTIPSFGETEPPDEDASRDWNMRIQIETAGTVWIPTLDAYLHDASGALGGLVDLVVSPKTPKVHPLIDEHARAWKYIIRHNETARDGLPIGNTQHMAQFNPAEIARPSFMHPYEGPEIFVQPMDESESPIAPSKEIGEAMNRRNIRAATESAMKHGYRVSLQMHKILDVE